MTLEMLNIATALPEMWVAGMACLILMVRLFDKTSRPSFNSFLLSTATLVIAGGLALNGQPEQSQIAFNGAFIADSMSSVIKAFVAFISAAVFIYGARYNANHGYFKTEFYVLGLFGVVGMMVLSSAASLLTLYVGLELFSLSLYAMVAFFRDSRVASEAAIKYFILGGLASAILLYAMSLLYGLTGSLEIAVIAEKLTLLEPGNLGLTLAIVLMVVGLAFKLGAVPFHMWVPDVYEGSPTSVTAYLAAAPKIAAFAMVIRLLVDTLQIGHDQWQGMLIILALLSVALGNVVAIAQTNIKRMLAYSTISHMGFFLFGILSGIASGYGASLFYVLVYAVMSVGAFGLILWLSDKDSEYEQISDFQGLSQRSPMMAFLMLMLMFSMAGIPPFAGFFAKFSVILSLIQVELVWVAVLAVLLAVIGAYYYLRIVKTMYFDDPLNDAPLAKNHWSVTALLVANVAVLLLILPWIGHMIDMTQRLMAG
jgi:NADH-quinone oxidoreductase subunit N